MTGTIPMWERSAPTLEDVARLAGVSRATVSRVVNGGNLVASATVESVNRAIGELGYRPNRAARALVTRRVGAVAVVVPEADERVFTDPFFPQAYHGALTAFSGTDTQVLLAIAEPGEGSKGMVRYLDSGHLDGAIVISHHGGDLAERLQEIGYPVVFVGDPGITGMPYAELDHYHAAMRGTKHLLDQGARRIATITGPMDMNAGRERRRGFEDAMAAAGLEIAGLEVGDFTAVGGDLAAQRILQRSPDLDGLFVASDLMGVGAMRAFHHAGRSVPEDILVVGFDNSTAALQTDPPLTTMTNPASELTRLAAEMLLQILDGHQPTSPVILTSELVRRGSA